MSSVKLLSISSVADALDVSTKSIRRWVADGSFPPPVMTPTGELRWHEFQVQSWAFALKPPEKDEGVKKKTP